MSVQQIGSGSGVTGVINAGAVQISESNVTYAVSTDASNGLIVPFIAELCADASGTVGTLQQVSVTMSGIDEVFDVEVAAADAIKILNAFRITDISAGYGEDARAEVKVDMKNSSTFAEGLAAAIAAGPVARNASGSPTLYSWLKAESRKDTVDLLSYDSLANLLEASDLLSYDIAIDASGAAVNMYNAMDGSGASAPLFRKAIFTQIAKANIDAYLGVSDGNNINEDDVTQLDFLPLLKGDKMTFVFDVTVGEYDWVAQSAPISGAKITSVVNDASVTSGVSGTYGGSTTTQQAGTVGGTALSGGEYSGLYAPTKTQLLFTTPSTRRVAIVVKMASGGVAFDHATDLHTPSELTA